MINTRCRYTNSSSHNPGLKTFIAGDRHQNASSLGTKSAGPVIRSLSTPRPWNIRTRRTPKHELCNRPNGYGSLDRCERDVTFKFQFLYWINQSILTRISALTEIGFMYVGNLPEVKLQNLSADRHYSIFLGNTLTPLFVSFLCSLQSPVPLHCKLPRLMASEYRSLAIWTFIVNAHMHALCTKACNHRSTPPIKYISFMQFSLLL